MLSIVLAIAAAVVLLCVIALIVAVMIVIDTVLNASMIDSIVLFLGFVFLRMKFGWFIGLPWWGWILILFGCVVLVMIMYTWDIPYYILSVITCIVVMSLSVGLASSALALVLPLSDTAEWIVGGIAFIGMLIARIKFKDDIVEGGVFDNGPAGNASFRDLLPKNHADRDQNNSVANVTPINWNWEYANNSGDLAFNANKSNNDLEQNIITKEPSDKVL